MPLFEGDSDAGLERLFIEIPDQAKDKIVWKWPDQQIVQFSQLNVDLDYQAVFTNVGKVIGVMGPGRYQLDEGASLSLGWLVDHLTGDAHYDAEVYFVTTRDNPNVEFGGPVDNLTDGPSGLVVTLEVHGELAFRVIDSPVLLARLIGAGPEDFNAEISAWVTDQTLASIRAILPDIVAEHGVLALGQLQDATTQAALAKANETLRTWGLSLSEVAELNVDLPDADAEQLKQFAATKPYSGPAGLFESGVHGAAALEIASGIANGHAGAQQGIVAGVMMNVPLTPPAAPGNGSAAPSNGSDASAAAPSTVQLCSNCGKPVLSGAHFCSNCGAAVS
jgi:membrane protease subunit (stomatin/prohibitin family)